MTTIISNGSKWAGEPEDTLAQLLEVLATETLSRTFENYGNFIFPPEGESAEWRVWGNFASVSHVFDIRTTDPDVISQLTSAIRANQTTAQYKAQPKPKKDKRKA